MDALTNFETKFELSLDQDPTDFAALPDLPSPRRTRSGDGYDWMDDLRGWTVISGWGVDGWDLGAWPYQILAVSRAHDAVGDVFGMCTYTEGDTTARALRTQDALYEAITDYAYSIWRFVGNGPENLPARRAALPRQYSQPYEGRNPNEQAGIG